VRRHGSIKAPALMTALRPHRRGPDFTNWVGIVVLLSRINQFELTY
jgi:hypothetical protein